MLKGFGTLRTLRFKAQSGLCNAYTETLVAIPLQTGRA